MLLKHDLHYSHKDPAVLSLLATNNIVTLFVPAGCTDVLQECDTVINRPFKVGMKAAFRDYLHKNYNEFRSGNPSEDVSEWKPPLTVGAMKPYLPGIVSIGIACLETPEIRLAIAAAFQRDGLFQEMRANQIGNRDQVPETQNQLEGEEADGVSDIDEEA
jgi:hypothetical protein